MKKVSKELQQTQVRRYAQTIANTQKSALQDCAKQYKAAFDAWVGLVRVKVSADMVNTFNTLFGPILQKETGWKQSTLRVRLSEFRKVSGLPMDTAKAPKTKKGVTTKITLTLGPKLSYTVPLSENDKGSTEEKLYDLLEHLARHPVFGQLARAAMETLLHPSETLQKAAGAK